MSDRTVEENDPLDRYRPWFYAAALYNLAWGVLIVLFPKELFKRLRMPLPNYLPLWQVVGMFVLVYAPAYWWAGRFPARHRQIILIGLLGKVLGPAGFVWSVWRKQMPLVFGVTIFTNDLIWWLPFGRFLRDSAKQHGGWLALLRGE